MIEKVDGVLEYICSLDAAQHIKLDRRYILNNNEEIQVTPNIKAKVRTVRHNEVGELVDVEFALTSTKLGINEMREWIDVIHREYCFEKENKLGQKKFYFNEVPVEPMQDMHPVHHHGAPPPKKRPNDGSPLYRWDTAPKTLTFTMNEFNTSKSFSNVFGDHVEELKERLDLFVNYPDWYEQRGIPHSLGILLHGIPGAGKTSTIKAIAHDTKRHIFNLSLRPYTTQKQLTHLFFNENVSVVNDDGTRQIFRIPIHQRLFVIEDIDCLTNVVFQRDPAAGPVENDGDRVTLSFLLNLLDGVLETPGRILVITSNYPERLDRALVRPGRIDVRIDFREANKRLIEDMFRNFYGAAAEGLDVGEEVVGKRSPAEILEVFCNNFKDPRAALAALKVRGGGVVGNHTFHPDDVVIPTYEEYMTHSQYGLSGSNSNISMAISEVTLTD
jgi:DNA replication protein DnaC